MRLCVKVTTPVKLNLFSEKEKTSLIAAEDELATEVHYVQYEGIHAEYHVNWSIFKKLWSMYRANHSLVIHDWVITDFDHFLKGNPIVRK